MSAVLHLQIQSFDLSLSRDLWAVLVAGVVAVATAIRRKRKR